MKGGMNKEQATNVVMYREQAMDQEQWKERSIRKKAIHEGARVRDGSRKYRGSNG